MKALPAREHVQGAVLRLLTEVVPWQFARIPLAMGLSLQRDLGIDSMGKLSVAFRVEEEFGLDLSGYGDQVAEILTVGDVVRFVEAALAQQQEE